VTRGDVHYCWHCYGANDAGHGRCRLCGERIEPPADVGYVDQLLWALAHPLVERRMVAARVLGSRRERRAIPRLRDLALSRDDPYLAAVALEALVSIEGIPALRKLLERLAAEAPPQVREAATAALMR
jgi:HEAT repeat protein